MRQLRRWPLDSARGLEVNRERIVVGRGGLRRLPLDGLRQVRRPHGCFDLRGRFGTAGGHALLARIEARGERHLTGRRTSWLRLVAATLVRDVEVSGPVPAHARSSNMRALS